MTFFENLMKQLFPEKQNENTPFLQENRLNEKPTQSYVGWAESDDARTLLEEIFQSYDQKSKGLQGDIDIGIYKGQGSNGLVVYFEEHYSRKKFQYLIDLLRDNVLALGYRQMNSNKKIYDREEHYETVIRHYLKPPIDRSGDAKADQKYGNILIEHISKNDEPKYIKFLVTYYVDHKFKKAGDFEELLERVCLK